MSNQEFREVRATDENHEIRGGRESHKSKIHRRKKWLSILALCIFLLGFLSGVMGAFLGIHFAKNAALVDREYLNTVTSLSEKYAKMEFLNSMIGKYYYGEFTQEQIMEGAYKGMFSSLDEYSQYLTEEEYQQLMNYTNSSFQGIGVVMTKTEDNRIQIVSVYDDSPAFKAKLKENDYIVAVDGKKYDGKHMEDCAVALRQDVGTKLQLTYEREGKENTVTIICNTVETGTVYSETLKEEDTGKEVGYIRIVSFGADTYKDFDNALRDMEVGEVKGLIIDLRDNGGGVVEEATRIADRLLPEGTIMVTKSKVEKDQYVNSDSSCTKLPYVVLVNERSASASEILTAAIKGNKGGAIIGTTTFGKGVLQNMATIGKGHDAFKITFAEYFGPNDIKINKTGIKPDYEVKLSEKDNKDIQLIKAMEVLKEEMDK